MKKTHVVIVGGGFGGVYATRTLLRKGYAVTIISRTNFFIFTPLLHEVATGALNSNDITFEYSDFFHDKNFTFYRETVTNVDFDSRIVITADDERVSYDYLILSTGAKTNFFGTKGSEHALELKTIEDAHKIKKQIIEHAQGIEREMVVNVVGGGPTGTELVLEIKEFLDTIKEHSPTLSYKVRLIHAGEALCQTFPETVQDYALATMRRAGVDVHLNTLVTEITPGSVVAKSGEVFEGDFTIWSAGVSPNTDLVESGCKDERGNVIVEESLRFAGREHEFAVGDVITREGLRIPKLAQTAIKQGSLAAENIDRHRRDREQKPYEVKLNGTLLSLGKGRGAGKIFGVTISGFLGWVIWRSAYLSKVPGLRNKFEVATTWMLNLFTARDLYEK